MSKFSSRINRFFLRHRDKGIPNLMLYICLGNAVVTVMSLFGMDVIHQLLCFNKSEILNGQVWRLVTFAFTEYQGGWFDLIFLYFFYMLGSQIERSIGTLKFNLYYFTGLLLLSVFGMICSPVIPEMVPVGEVSYWSSIYTTYASMAYYLHLSMALAFATTNPDAQFLVFFIIPVKAWVMALIYLVIVAASVYTSFGIFPHNLLMLVGIANYFIYFWDSLPNLMPLSWRMKLRRRKKSKGPKVIHFEQQTGPYRTAPKKEDFLHKCTVCGRTDTSDPGLEFRYCSRCSGYHCYCIDHINQHTHIE